MKLLFLLLLILAPGTVFAAQLAAKRKPSGIAVAQPPLRLELSTRDDSDPQWNCGSHTERASGAAGGDSIVKRFARYDTLFESMIDSATHHDAYKLRFKLYF